MLVGALLNAVWPRQVELHSEICGGDASTLGLSGRLGLRAILAKEGRILLSPSGLDSEKYSVSCTLAFLIKPHKEVCTPHAACG